MKRLLLKILRAIKGSRSFAGSGSYWERRYKSGGTSGGGSYGRLALYKADFLNAFFSENKIQSVVEWGCGDGNQTSLLQVPSYLGLDVAPTAVDKCRKKFGNDPTKSFGTIDNFDSGQRKELALSLDVLYHLVEDDIYENYMNCLFESASRFVVIYSCNFDGAPTANHVRPRKFSSLIDRNFSNWKLVYTEKNPFPMTVMNDPETSWSEFFVYALQN